ncbi:uncharacterized protein LOC143230534 [Tachypleus tridentatus]|uniref:uncharacterized protein LOC143230534 n=1 Tax=Tachypleus tridentatus TaxID=6853 RepID=UPI003FCFC9F8
MLDERGRGDMQVTLVNPSSIIESVFVNGKVSGGGQRSMKTAASSPSAGVSQDSQSNQQDGHTEENVTFNCELGFAASIVRDDSVKSSQDARARMERKSGLYRMSQHEEQQTASSENKSCVSQVHELATSAHELSDGCSRDCVETNQTDSKRRNTRSESGITISSEFIKLDPEVRKENITDPETGNVFRPSLTTHMSANDDQVVPAKIKETRSASKENKGKPTCQFSVSDSSDIHYESKERIFSDAVCSHVTKGEYSVENNSTELTKDATRHVVRQCEVPGSEWEREVNNSKSDQKRKMSRSLLKKNSNRSKSEKMRVKFSETMTVFSEEFSKPQQVTMQSTELFLNYVSPVHDPPPQYQNSLNLKTPSEYRDTLINREPCSTLVEPDSFLASKIKNNSETINENHKVKEESRMVSRASRALNVVVKNTNLVGITGDNNEKSASMNKEPLCDLLNKDEGKDENVRSFSSAIEYLQDIATLSSNSLSTHGKLIEALDTRPADLGLSTMPSAPESQLPSLSPPLNQFSVDLVHHRKEDEDWQVQLSPLSSIQETDSDSSVSSQDTIIMMTSEESKRNENHVRGSFRQYEELRKEILGQHTNNKLNEILVCSSPQDSEDSKSTGSSSSLSDDRGPEEYTTKQCQGINRSNSQIRRALERSALRRSLQKKTEVRKRVVPSSSGMNQRVNLGSPSDISLMEKIRWLTTVNSEEYSKEVNENGKEDNAEIFQSSNLHYESPFPQQLRRWDMLDVPYFKKAEQPIPAILGKRQLNIQKCLPMKHGKEREDLSSRENKLASLVIPDDLRDWKIGSQLAKNKLKSSITNCYDRSHMVSQDSANRDVHKSRIPPLVSAQGVQNGVFINGTSDELELFVNQDFNRIERLRKRYSLSEEDSDPTFGFSRRPSVRGIRPRFGSTTEILKQMQLQLQPPELANPKHTGSHVTWPYMDIEIASRSKPSAQRQTPGVILLNVKHEERINGVGLIPKLYSSLPPNPVRRDHVYSSTNNLASQLRTPKFQENTFTELSENSVATDNHNSKPAMKERSISSSKGERGTPEGASSSPKVSSDSVYHRAPSRGKSKLVKQTGIIYYTMNV